MDGQENPTTLIRNARFYEVQKHLSLTRHAYTAGILAMSKRRFDSLSPAHRDAVAAVAAAVTPQQRQMNEYADAEALADLKKHGMAVVEAPNRDSLAARWRSRCGATTPSASARPCLTPSPAPKPEGRAMRVIDLSMPIAPHFRWPTQVSVTGDIARGDQFRVSRLDAACHGFTHVDAQAHILADAPTIEATPLDRVVGPCRVLRLERVGPEEEIGPERLAAADPEGSPDAVDGGRRVADRLGHRAQRPVRRSRRCRLQRQPDRVGDLAVADLAGRPWPRLVQQTVQPMRSEAAAPLADRVGVRPDLGADRLVLQPRRGRQHDARPARHGLAGLLRPGQRLQLPALRRAQLNPNRGPAHGDHPSARGKIPAGNFPIRTLEPTSSKWHTARLYWRHPPRPHRLEA